MSSIPTIPSELIIEILSFLRYHRRTLAHCSLVSHQWYQLSGPFLFHSLHLRDPPPGYPNDPFDALYAFICDNSRIRGLVRELRLGPVDSQFEVKISLGRIRSLLASLPSLNSLIVDSIQLHEIPGDGPGEGQDEHRPLRLQHAALSASFCLGIHQTFLSRFLSLFEQIAELQIQGAVMYRTLHNPHRFNMPVSYDLHLAADSVRPAVRSLTLVRFDLAQRLLPVLPAFVRIDALEALRVSHFTGGLVAMVDALLCQTPNMRELTLLFHRFASANLSYAVAQSEKYHLPGLTRCPHLESLALGVEIHLDYDLIEINQVYWRRCLEPLSSAPSTLCRVSVSIQTWAVTGTNYFEPLAELDWELLDSVLSHFTHLTTIKVYISSRNIGRWILAEDEMRSRLAEKLSARNRSMLHIAFGDAP